MANVNGDSGWRTERVNIPWVIGSWSIGALLIAGAFATEHFYRWRGVSIDTMVSVGSAFLLAGVLFFLQRRFLVEVEEAVERAATSAADARVDERVQEVDARLDELGERMNEVLAERKTRQDRAIQAMDVPTFESVAGALAEANKLGAFAYDHVTVQASRDLNELGLEFSWGIDLGDGRFGQPQRAVLMVSAHVYADERGSGARWVIETPWEAGDTADQVGLRLREQLENRGRWRGNDTLDWPRALRNLKRSLDIAISSRRRDGGEFTIQGALFELVGDEWAITDAGLECPPRGFILPESAFPDRNMAALRRIRNKGEVEEWSPSPPEWVDVALWDELVLRARQHFPIPNGPILGSPGWIALKDPPEAGSARITGS